MKYVFGNWKMHGSHKESVTLAKGIAAAALPKNIQVAVFPPFTSLYPVKKELTRSAINLGGQDCSPEENGAFTGDISGQYA